MKSWTKRTVAPTVYKIVNTITGDFYVGSAWRPTERMYSHWGKLKKGKHENVILQRAANKYGWWSLQFEVVRSWDASQIDRKTLYALEQQYINTLNPIYNIAREVGRPIVSEEAKEKFKRLYSKRWIVINPKGVEYQITNLKQFCRENDLCQANMWYVAQGKSDNVHGWRCRYADGSTPFYISKSEREYRVTLPDGSSRVIRNLSRFCKGHNLSYNAMIAILSGTQNQHRGFRVEKTRTGG